VRLYKVKYLVGFHALKKYVHVSCISPFLTFFNYVEHPLQNVILVIYERALAISGGVRRVSREFPFVTQWMLNPSAAVIAEQFYPSLRELLLLVPDSYP